MTTSLFATKDRLFQIWIISCFVLFLGAGLTGITGSSFSLIQAQSTSDSFNSDPSFGEAREVRSDEYLKSTPWRLGVLKSGNASFQTPLANSDNALFFPDPDNWINTLSAIDILWPRLVPGINLSQEFAFTWWTPILLALIALPLFLREVGTNSLTSIAIAVTVVSSPVNAWWSFWVSPVIGFTSLACYMFIKGAKFLGVQNKLAIPAFIIVAFSAFKLVTCYQPWVIVIASITLLPAFVYSINVSGFRNSFKSLGYSGLIFSGLTGAFLFYNKSGIQAILGTSYPGQRRSSGDHVPELITWGAPHLQILSLNPDLNGSNNSELSSSLSVLMFAALAVFSILLWHRKQLHIQTAAFLTLGFWVSWVTLPWPTWSSKIPLISLVPPHRAAGILGILAAFSYAYVSQKSTITNRQLTRSNLFLAGTAALVSLSVTLISGRQMQEVVPRLGNIRITVACIAIAVIVFLLVLEKTRTVGAIGIALFSIVLTISVNPIQRNLDGISTGDVALELNELAAKGGLWASDDPIIDALLMANAIPALSGMQLTGPNFEKWNLLDSNSTYKDAWNRGVSSITFDWQQEESVVINAPNPDVITVGTNPCVLSKTFPEINFIASKNELVFPCLSKVSQFYQKGKIKHIYVIERD
jgi:hypothetical protein